MEQQTTDSTEALTEEQLRDAGASVAYISYYLTAVESDVHTNSTDHAERVVNSDVSYSGDGTKESVPGYGYVEASADQNINAVSISAKGL